MHVMPGLCSTGRRQGCSSAGTHKQTAHLCFKELLPALRDAVPGLLHFGGGTQHALSLPCTAAAVVAAQAQLRPSCSSTGFLQQVASQVEAKTAVRVGTRELCTLAMELSNNSRGDCEALSQHLGCCSAGVCAQLGQVSLVLLDLDEQLA